MNLTQITAFFGWSAFINVAFLLLATVLILLLKDKILPWHHKLLGMPQAELNALYIRYLSYWKLLTLIFFVTPYLALKLIS